MAEIVSKHQFSIFADYHQYYLQDEQTTGDLSNSWTEQAVKDRVALAPGTIGVGTVRNVMVPVTIVIYDSTPPEEDYDRWNHINECSLNVPSGRIVVVGCTDFAAQVIAYTFGNHSHAAHRRHAAGRRQLRKL